MEDWAFWQGSNLFIVIFLLVFVVGLSCGLLGFICMKILEDRFGDGASPTMFFTGHNSELLNNAPTKIIVTSPPTDEVRSVTSAASVKDEKGLQLQHPFIKVKSNNGRKSSANRVGPTEKVIYSNENSPATSPVPKVFVWSKSNYDFFEQSDKEKDEGRQSYGRPNTPSSPLGLFHNFQAKSHSPPAGQPGYVGRRHSVLHF